jgi:hypothetical protein
MWLTHALRLCLLSRYRFIHTGEVLSPAKWEFAREARFQIVPWGYRCFAAMKRTLNLQPGASSAAYLNAEMRRNLMNLAHHDGERRPAPKRDVPIIGSL